MKFILKPFAIVDRTGAPGSCPRRIAALDDEARDESVENGVVVVAIETVLEEVSGGEGSLFGEEFEG